jgi:DNA-binding HxlR family transcriptional regulator
VANVPSCAYSRGARRDLQKGLAVGRLYGCPVELALELIGGKWKTVILARLKENSMRYGELRRAIPDLADKVLTQRLRDLEENGFVERSSGGTDDAIRYRLTSYGRSLAPALEALYAWGEAAGRKTDARYREPGVIPSSRTKGDSVGMRRR